jgi:hypothetical protein
MGNEVRDAVEPAKTQPRAFSSPFNELFAIFAINLNITPINIIDSATVFITTVDHIQELSNGTANPETMGILKSKSQSLLAKHSELQALLN